MSFNLPITGGNMASGGLRASFLTHGTKLEADYKCLITNLPRHLLYCVLWAGFLCQLE